MENCQWCLDDRRSLHAIHTKWCSRCWFYGGRVKMWVSSQASASVEHEVRINGRLISVIGAERNRRCISWSKATVCVFTYFFSTYETPSVLPNCSPLSIQSAPAPAPNPTPLGPYFRPWQALQYNSLLCSATVVESNSLLHMSVKIDIKVYFRRKV